MAKRLPRKKKKQLKKNTERWIEHKERKRKEKERCEHMDIIFNRNYDNVEEMFRKLL